MAATQLGVFNKALRWLEERKLASLTEQREPLRYLLDEWSDAILYTLRQGPWRFARRLVMVQNDQNQGPNFGFEFCFTKPPDWVRTYQMADNDGFNPLFRGDQFSDQNNVWYANISPVYINYISNDPNWGLNVSLWTPEYVEYLAIYLAWICAPRLKQDMQKVGDLEKRQKRQRISALAIDAMDEPPGVPPYGTWVQSRAPRGSVLPYGQPFPGELD